MSWLSEFLENPGKALEKVGRKIVRNYLSVYARPFNVDIDDPLGIKKQQRRAQREAEQAQAELEYRLSVTLRARAEAAGRIPLSQRQMELQPNNYIPQYFGLNRITPLLYKYIYYSAPYVTVWGLGGPGRSVNFSDDVKLWGIIGMGEYETPTRNNTFLVRSPIDNIWRQRGTFPGSVLNRTTTINNLSAILPLQRISTNAEEITSDSTALDDSTLTDWNTLWENETPIPTGSINRYFLEINCEFQSLTANPPVKFRLDTRATFYNPTTQATRTTTTSGYTDYTTITNLYNTSGTGTTMIDPEYNGTYRFYMQAGSFGRRAHPDLSFYNTYPYASTANDYLVKLEMRVASARLSMNVYSAKLEMHASDTDPRFTNTTSGGAYAFYFTTNQEGGEEPLEVARFNYLGSRRLQRWNGTAYALTAENATGREQARNAYAIVEHLLHEEWGIPINNWDATTLRHLRDTHTADTFDGVIDPEQTYFDVIAGVLNSTRVSPYITRGGLRFIRDEYLAPSMLFSEADISDLQIDHDHDRIIDGVEANYYNPDLEIEETIIIGLNDTLTVANGVYTHTEVGDRPINPNTLDGAGMRGQQRCLRYMHQEWLALKYRRTAVTFTAGPEADALNPGDVVYVQMLGEGDTAEINDVVGQELRLSRPLDGPTVRFRNPSGAYSPEFTLSQMGESITILNATISGGDLSVGDDGIAVVPGETRVISAATGQLLRIKVGSIQGAGDAGGMRIIGFIDDPRAYPENTEGEAVTFSAPSTITTQFTTAIQTLSSWRRTQSAVYDTTGEYQLWQNTASSEWFIRRIAADGATTYARSASNPTLTATTAWTARATIAYVS